MAINESPLISASSRRTRTRNRRIARKVDFRFLVKYEQLFPDPATARDFSKIIVS